MIRDMGRTTSVRARFAAACGFVALATSGCSSVGGSAIRTGPVQLPAYAGPVAVYSTGQGPSGAVDLGVVEVHAAQQEGTIDALVPQFVRKVAQIGGDVAVVEGIRARFELVGRTHVETFYFTCARGATCAGTRLYAANDELMTVSVFGRALSTRVLQPGEQPLMPFGQSPTPELPIPSAAEPAPAGVPAPAPSDTPR